MAIHSGPVQVLDRYYLAITGIVTVAFQLLFFAIAFSLKFDKLTDFAGGTNFILLSCLTWGFSENRNNARNIISSLFLIIWAARLSGFLLFRILKTGKDDRFDDMRDKFFKFLGFWVFQMIWVWTVSLPVTVLNSPGITSYAGGQPGWGTRSDIIGVVFFVVGFLFEAVSDVQKYRFRSKHGNDGAVCDVGLFHWSRHPNYFGEILLQFGIWFSVIAPATHDYVPGKAQGALIATIVGPLLLTVLLMFVSGLPLQERPTAKKRYEKQNHWPEYAAWLHRTSMLWPFPTRLYSRMPTILRRTIFLEFPMYVFDPVKHADESKRIENERNQHSSHGEANHTEQV